MSRIVNIAERVGAPRASLVFVHGLGGHAYDTWRRNRKQPVETDKTFWPLWLAEDVEGLAVYSLAYEAPPTNWLGTSMPLQDRAVNVLEILLSEPGLRKGPIAFVCHSLGGLVVKQILLDLQQQRGRRPEAADLLERVTKVVFIATPHTGARQATWLDRLRFFAWPSSVARTLVANDPTLRSINVAYRGLADERRTVLRHRVFYETEATPAGVIVDEASADPGLPGDPPVPVDADHVSIVKPFDRAAIVYARTRDFLAECPAADSSEGDLEVASLPEIRSERSLNVVPKAIRLAAVGLVAWIGFKGVQTVIAPPPPIDQEKLEQKIETGHKEQMTSIDALRLEIAREKGVAPEKLAPLFEHLGMMALSPDQMRERAEEAIKGILALAKQKVEPSKDGVDIDKAITASRAKLADLDTAGAQAVLDKKIAQEEEARRRRLVPLLAEKAKIARLSYDYPTAKATLEELLRLDPNNVWGWIDLGDIWVTTGLLGEAAKAFRAAEGAARQTGNERDLAASVGRLGDVQVAQGDLSAALKSFSDSLAIADRLAKSDPMNSGWQRDLSVSYTRVGDVQVAQGDLKAALKSFSDSLAIVDRLAKSDPGNAQWQFDLGISNERIGDVQVAQGNLAAALASYEARREIIARLAKSDPGNAGWQRDLAVSYGKLGSFHRDNGDKAKASEYFGHARAILARLTELSPENATWKQHLAWLEAQIAEVEKGSSKSEPKRR